MISRFARRLSGVLACMLLAACSTSQPAQSNRGHEEFSYSRDMPVIAAGDWSARGTVVTSSDEVPFDFSQLPAGSTARTMVYRSISGITG